MPLKTTKIQTLNCILAFHMLTSKNEVFHNAMLFIKYLRLKMQRFKVDNGYNHWVIFKMLSFFVLKHTYLRSISSNKSLVSLDKNNMHDENL